MAQASLSTELLVTIRDLVVRDPVALDKWPTVVDHIVGLAADSSQIKKLFKDGEYHEAVLQSLYIWWQAGGARADLLKVLQEFGLNEISGKLTTISSSLIIAVLISCVLSSCRQNSGVCHQSRIKKHRNQQNRHLVRCR
jgi:hypothetical protein